MSRPNQPRTIAVEQALARRLAYERERRGMSYDGLASRMTKAGCPIQPSGLYKIEKAGRRITVDELAGLAKVFDLEISELLQPVELILHADITKVEEIEQAAWNDLFEAVDRLVAARDDRGKLYRRATEGDDPDLAGAVEAFWAELRKPQAQQGERADGRGGLQKAVERREAEVAAWTPEEWADSERRARIDAALDVLVDAIHDNTDEILGDS
jgi:transcriptional regulator with XRE-family HTH domain